MGRKSKAPPIPQEDRRICRSICLCQLTVVMSCVALVYLTVAIYMPSHRAFQSGIEPEPVMCQTVASKLQTSYCDWASCGEWCLTKTAGFCPQIHVTVRRNGTDIVMENCLPLTSAVISCPQVYPGALKKYNCNNGTECESLTGVFNCSLGHCANMSEMYQCHHKADGITVNSERDNMKLNGFFECDKATCIKIKHPFVCDRLCPKISTLDVNTYLLYEDNVYTGNCERTLAFNRANGTSVGSPVNATEIWQNKNSTEVLMASCLSVKIEDSSIKAIDCINGTIQNRTNFPKLFMNFTTMWSLYENSTILVDTKQNFLPAQSDLTIYNWSRLYINLEACVNTLQGECKLFQNTHGRGGENHTMPSRFHCYYDKKDPFFVVARFDLRKTWRELMVAALVPSLLFLVSTTTLCIITRSVTVGDDARMRCKYCSGGRQVVHDACAGDTTEDEDGPDSATRALAP
uniref:Uncharacterized protein n=1 Tax=Timema monikensis TaxID=170555 RepID=A0A7R9E4Y8_9NEOP|nr:unnamed protein product [Timema monikensis]